MARAETWRDLRGITACLVILLGFACALISPQLALAEPFSVDESGHVLLIDPLHSESFSGWRAAVTTVRVVPTRSGTPYYQWDTPVGEWQPVDGEIMVPEGRHTLLTRMVDADGRPGPVTGTDFRIDFDAVALPLDIRTVSSTGTASGTVAVTAYVLPQVGSDMVRHGGRDRYETSVEISRGNFDSSEYVILATGRTYADALSASGLAGSLDCPILITDRDQMPTVTRSEIVRLGASKMIIVGGTAAVAPTVETSVRSSMGLQVERIGGRDRYHTAALIADRIMGFGQAGGRVYVARGNEFADALSLGPLAAAGNAPLLLTQPGNLPGYTRASLQKYGFSTGVVAGGTAAVSSRVFGQIDSLTGTTVRLAGRDRYDTCARVARYGVASGIVSYRVVGVATGSQFPDALCGGAAMGRQRGIIVLVQSKTIPSPARSVMLEAVPTNQQVQVFGGTAAVSNDVWDELVSIFMAP